MAPALLELPLMSVKDIGHFEPMFSHAVLFPPCAVLMSRMGRSSSGLVVARSLASETCRYTSESCAENSCAAGDLPACADVGESWTPPSGAQTLSNYHCCASCRASGLVQIANALIDNGTRTHMAE
jgi:hypothetical protein